MRIINAIDDGIRKNFFHLRCSNDAEYNQAIVKFEQYTRQIEKSEREKEQGRIQRLTNPTLVNS